MDLAVERSTFSLTYFSSLEFCGSQVPTKPPQRAENSSAFHSFFRASTRSPSKKPLESHSARTKILYVDPVWNPEDPPKALSVE